MARSGPCRGRAHLRGEEVRAGELAQGTRGAPPVLRGRAAPSGGLATRGDEGPRDGPAASGPCGPLHPLPRRSGAGRQAGMSDRFPIRSSTISMTIPWEMIAPYEGMAMRLHSQTLKRLAERGGLSPREALCILDQTPWFQSPWKDKMERDAVEELQHRVDRWMELQAAMKISQMEKWAEEQKTALLEARATVTAERKRRQEAEVLLKAVMSGTVLREKIAEFLAAK